MNKQLIGASITLLVLVLFSLGIGYEFFETRGLSQPGFNALAILIVAATLWVTEAVPLFVTSLIVLFLSMVWLLPSMESAGLDASRTDFLSPFFADVIVLFLGGFALSAALHKKQLDEWLAAAIISRTGSTLPRLLIGIMAVTAFLSMWLSNTATAAMMLALVLPIATRLGEGDLRSKAILLSIPFAANVGGLGTPIGSPPNAIAMQYMSSVGIAPTFAQWMMIGVPGVLIMLVLAWVVLMFFFGRGDKQLPSVNQSVTIERDRSFWIVIAAVAATTIGWMTSSLHGYSSGTVALIPLIVFFAAGVLDTGDLNRMSWNVLLMMGGGLCLGTVISKSGLADWLVQQLPVEGVSIFWLTALFGVVACAMSSLMSNTATANLLLPIIIGMNIEPATPMMVGTAFGCSLAMPLPISTPPNAMAFSSGQIKVMDMAKPGLLLTTVGIGLALTTGYWWWDLVGIW